MKGSDHSASADVSDESPDQRITRNWEELLQELRVTQTGVQILSGFLLTVPFSTRFTDLTSTQQSVYLLVLMGSLLTTVLVVAPVAFHRLLFRQRMRPWLVEVGNRCAKAGLLMMAVTCSGALALVVDVVEGGTLSIVAFVGSLAAFAAVWVGLPMVGGQRVAEGHGVGGQDGAS